MIHTPTTPTSTPPAPTENDTGAQEDLSPPQVQVTPAPSSTPGEPAPLVVRAPLDDLGPAPELTNQVWINADRPLRLAELRGKVVLLDMWTFG